MNEPPLTLKKCLVDFRSHWDNPKMRPIARSEFLRVISCREMSSGAEGFHILERREANPSTYLQVSSLPKLWHESNS